MVWARFDDTWADAPDVVGLTDTAFRAYVESVLYVSRYSTDGRMPKAAAPRRANAKVSAELVAAELWETDPAGYYLPQWERHTPSRAELEKARATNAGRVTRHRRDRRVGG